MDASNIPDDVRRYIVQCVPSVPYLEAITLMSANAEATWDARLLAQRLYLDEPRAETLLQELRAAGIATADADGRWRYAPSSPQLAELLARVVDIYARHLVEVSTLVHSKSNRKARLFADAFVWRKDK
ncbi:hypothetical protein ACHMW6_20155 [Pseudoduganella sp. UC29_106]|uniref:hypothetical protein n=1 Tax=Pseudoduganella sp. UC29_106 TaxID=3374553 RepID=UPI003757598B